MILDYYIGARFFRFFILALLAITMIFLLGGLIDILGDDSEQAIRYLLLYLLYSIPNIILQSMPVALLLASTATISALAANSELAVIHSAGRSFYRLILPLFLISLLASLVYFFASEFTITQTNVLATRNKIYYTKGIDHSLYEQMQSRSLKGSEGYYYFSSLDEEKELIYGGFCYLKVGPDGSPLYFYDADTASYRRKSRDWIMQDVKIVKFNAEMEVGGVTQRDSFIVQLPEDISFFKRPLPPGELGILTLMKVIDNLQRQGLGANRYQVELHSRFSFPLICILLTLMGALWGSRGMPRSINPLARAISISAGVIFVYYVGFSIGNSLGKVGLFHPALATWGPTSVFGAITLALVSYYRK